jgi:hypothetical protein
MGIPQKPLTFRLDESLLEHVFEVQTSRDPMLTQAEAIRLIIEQHSVLSMMGILNLRENTLQAILRILCSSQCVCSESSETERKRA